ncbi:MAG: hypothetical protein ACJ8GN_02935 [Longimicrobiaceae bacterium]
MSEYTTAQQAVLRTFLAETPSLRFVPETEFDQRELRRIRADDRNFKPYYAAGDFTGDGKRDFAVLLRNVREGGVDLVIFNQIPGNTYRVAHTSDMHRRTSETYIITNANADLCMGSGALGICFPWENGRYGFVHTS